MSEVKVLWALDIDAKKGLVDKLREGLGREVLVVGVGHLETADDVIEAMRELGADEAVIDFDSACEVERLLDAGIHPIVALFDEVETCSEESRCSSYNPDTDILVEKEEGVTVMRLSGFARVTDIMFELADIGEKNSHEH